MNSLLQVHLADFRAIVFLIIIVINTWKYETYSLNKILMYSIVNAMLIVLHQILRIFHNAWLKLYTHWRATPHFPLPPALVITVLLSDFMNFFKKHHISGSVQYLSFYDWIISLSIMSSNFIHVVAYSILKAE